MAKVGIVCAGVFKDGQTGNVTVQFRLYNGTNHSVDTPSRLRSYSPQDVLLFFPPGSPALQGAATLEKIGTSSIFFNTFF